MHSFRRTWMALMGAILIVTLSVSVAFGAKPTTSDGPRGQSVSAFVHDLVFGSDETDADEVAEEEGESTDDEEGSEGDQELSEGDEVLVEDGEETASGQEHGECVSEEASDKTDEVDEEGNHGSVVNVAARETCWEPDDSDEETAPEEDEDEQEQEEDSERQVPEEFANHGECVSTAAHDSDGYGDSDADNFGEWMSMHARYVCWGLEVADEEADEDVEDSTVEEEEDAEEASAREARKAERAAARAERRAAREAAMAERKAGKANAAAQRGGGHGKGRGGGRP